VKILIATVQVPFVRGGAEVVAEGLRQALLADGHEAEITAIPFKWYPPERILEHMLACRLLDLSESSGSRVDRVIGLKFPAYLVNHPNKTLWLLHQHRPAYDLWDSAHGDVIDSPEGRDIRAVILNADRRAFSEMRGLFTISRNVSARVKRYCGHDSTALYPPVQDAERFFCAEAEEYLFFPSRLTPLKRQALVLEALARVRQPVKVRLAGAADYPAYADELKSLACRLGVQDRVDWLGRISEEEKRQAYARTIGVIFPPVDEDYGLVTVEAMLASKPVLTCSDSGAPLEFVRDGETGLVVGPTAEALAAAMDRLWDDRSQARIWGEAGRAEYDSLGLSWRRVAGSLLS
jgi:glycosyltransferase involved in cell wall biosynthesis